MKVMLEPDAYKPERAYSTDAGLDIKAMHDGIVRAKQSATFHTGIHIQLPDGTMGDIRPKSGLMFKHDLLTFGTVDMGYSSEIMVHMFNLSDNDYLVRRGDKIAQLVVADIRIEDVEIVDYIEGGERQHNGFGSTGYR